MPRTNVDDERFAYTGPNGLDAHPAVRVYLLPRLAPLVITNEGDNSPRLPVRARRWYR